MESKLMPILLALAVLALLGFLTYRWVRGLLRAGYEKQEYEDGSPPERFKELAFREEPLPAGCNAKKESRTQLRVEKVFADEEEIVLSLAIKIVSSNCKQFLLREAVGTYLWDRAYLLDDDRTKIFVVKDGGFYTSSLLGELDVHLISPGETYRFLVSFPRTSAPLKDLVFRHPQFQPVQIRLH